MRGQFSVYLLILFIFNWQLHAQSHHPQVFLESIKNSKEEGKQIYLHFCSNCHDQKPLIPLGAPKIGDVPDWKMRLKQQAAILFQHTDEGFNAMPPRGGCFECTDEQLILSIITMVPKEAQKNLLNQLHDYKKSKKMKK